MSCRRASSESASELVRLFVERSPVDTQDPLESMCFHVRKLRADATRAGSKPPFEAVLHLRHIDDPEYDDGLSCDGCLVPKGRAYADGFRMLLRSGAPRARTRFTFAHEICHSFFYEIVPEIKFSEHSTDDEEERLCNTGAAELLMPADSIQRDADGRAMSLSTLTSLASEYGVSVDAMLTRLRGLRIWSCELTVWHRLTNGRFACDRKLGGINHPGWQWLDPSVLEGVWNEPKAHSQSGRVFVSFTDDQGRDYSTLVYYEAQRRGGAVFALWSRRKMPKAASLLFRKQARRSKSDPPSGSGLLDRVS